MYTIYSDEDIDIMIEEVEDIHNGVFIHTNVKKFSLSIYKKIKCVFNNIKAELKEKNVNYILAIPPTEKEQKWQECFGFTYSGIHFNKHKLMRIYI